MDQALAWIESITTSYSPVMLFFIITLAVVAGLVILALGFRLYHTMKSVKRYDEACKQVDAIQEKLEELHKQALASHAEIFSLQQTIYQRNNEILELKKQLLEVTKKT